MATHFCDKVKACERCGVAVSGRIILELVRKCGEFQHKSSPINLKGTVNRSYISPEIPMELKYCA